MNIRKNPIRAFAVLSLSLLFLSYNLAWSDSLTVSISAPTILTSESFPSPRILFNFDLPTELDSCEIVFAEFTLPVTASIPDSAALPIYCAPMNASWTPETISWGALGDTLNPETVEPDRVNFPVTSSGSQPAYFNITGLINRWRDGAPNYGLIFFAIDSQLSLAYTAGDEAPTLKITYEHY
jgi:hypothetical protein